MTGARWRPSAGSPVDEPSSSGRGPPCARDDHLGRGLRWPAGDHELAGQRRSRKPDHRRAEPRLRSNDPDRDRERAVHACLPELGRAPHNVSIYADASATDAGLALEGADDPRRHPAAVEPARLGRRALVADPRLVNEAGVERVVSGDRLVPRQRPRVRPGDVRDRAPRQHEGSIRGLALPLARRGVRAWLEEVQPNVGRREVVDGRPGGLEDAERVRRLGDRDAVDDDPDPLPNRLDPRRSGVVPDRLLPGARPYPIGWTGRRASSRFHVSAS